MNKNLLNRNLFLFLLITAISIGGIIVYAKNNMLDANNTSAGSNILGNTTNTAQKTNQEDPQTIQNFDINNIQNEQEVKEAISATPTTAPANAQNQTKSNPQNQTIQNVTELKIEDVRVGSGAEVKNGDRVEVNYLGTFLNGQKFDSSYDRNQAFQFSVGAGEVIKGWDLGLVGMKTGGKRILLIPSDLAYGAAGAPGAIPPNTPLKFEIELVAIKQ